jgi:Plasmid pRiA4b ORF-3-like protein
VNENATVRIELCHSDPLIWRQVEVPTSVTLKVLHNIIQAVIWGGSTTDHWLREQRARVSRNSDTGEAID